MIPRIILAGLLAIFSLQLSAQRISNLTKYEANNRNSQVYMGKSIVVSDSIMFVGAPGDDHGDNSYKNNAGAVYVYRLRNDGKWKHDKIITPEKRESYGDFGWSLAYDQNTLVVGSPSGNYCDGLVYVFEYHNGEWVEKQILKSPLSGCDDFGHDVDLSGNVMVVGMPEYGVDIAGTSRFGVGAALVFQKDKGEWVYKAKLQAEDGRESDNFGSKVACSEQFIIASAPSKVVEIKQENGGAVYAFHLENNSYVAEKLTARKSITHGYFGSDIALEGNTLLVGHMGYMKQYQRIGSAEIFHFKNGLWQPFQELHSSHHPGHNFFGGDVAIKNDHIIIGAHSQGSRGFVSLFSRSNDNRWYETDEISNKYGHNTYFGSSVSLSNNFAAVGAENDDYDIFETNYKDRSGSAFTFNYKITEKVFGRIPPQYICASEETRIPFNLFNVDPNEEVDFDIVSYGSGVVRNNPENLRIEDGSFIVVKPNLGNGTSQCTLQLSVKNQTSVDPITIDLTVYSPAQDYQYREICYGDSLEFNGVYYKESTIQCDTIYRSLGCYDLECIELLVHDPIDTSITRISSNTLMANNTTESYRWIDCETTATANGVFSFPTYTSTRDGWYAVDITEEECTVRSTCYYLSATPTTGLAKQEQQEAKLSVNREMKSMQLFLAQQHSVQLMLFNTLGKKVIDQSARDGDVFDLSNLASGIYVAKILDKNSNASISILL